ncbi:MAG: CHRD domain-containing protein [Burkholderiaceae bacterium]|nr:CHRD domain-containing protein [Burkholderiaceae bacterium]
MTACALTGCATVDLGPDTDAPQVQMPGGASAAPAPQYAPPLPAPPVQTMPVAPEGTVTQPLPPPGSADNGAPASSVPPGDEPVANTPPDGDGAPGNAQLVTLTTRPDGASETQPTSSGAMAQIDLVYNPGTRLLRWKAQWTNLSSPITAIRFHGPAAQGQDGPPTLIWPGPFGPTYDGRATLTPEQATDLVGGLWYVNISTVNYPGGEIRGQLQVVY